MTVIVTDTGFGPDTYHGIFADIDAARPPGQIDGLDVPNDFDVAALSGDLDRITAIRIPFPSSADGRGFSVARRLRLMGFTGRLRAQGHVLADQYAMARRCGFDEIEIDDALAARQPQDQWLFRAEWQEHDYQNRMRRSR